MYLGQDEPEPGTPEFGQQAAQRRAAIGLTPIPPTSGPPLLYLPAQQLAAGVQTAAGALGKGLFSGASNLIVLAAIGYGAYLLFSKGRR